MGKGPLAIAKRKSRRLGSAELKKPVKRSASGTTPARWKASDRLPGVKSSAGLPRRSPPRPQPPAEKRSFLTSLLAVTATSLRGVLHSILSKVGYGREHVMLTRQGQPVAVLISPEDYNHYRALEDYLDGLLATQALKEHEASGGKTIPFDDVCRELGL